MMARKTHTSTEVKNRWNAKTYKPYRVSLRKDEDAALIKWIEENRGEYSITEIFRVGVEELMHNED